MYKYDIFQVYRALIDYDCGRGTIIPKDTLLQIKQYRGSSIALLAEDKEGYYWIQARDLLNEDNFQRVF